MYAFVVLSDCYITNAADIQFFSLFNRHQEGTWTLRLDHSISSMAMVDPHFRHYFCLTIFEKLLGFLFWLSGWHNRTCSLIVSFLLWTNKWRVTVTMITHQRFCFWISVNVEQIWCHWFFLLSSLKQTRDVDSLELYLYPAWRLRLLLCSQRVD